MVVSAVETQYWPQLGVYLAKITSDIFGKNPLSTTWSYRNSESISGPLLVSATNITAFVNLESVAQPTKL